MADYVDTQADIAAIDETAAAFARKITKLEELIEGKRTALNQTRARDIDRAGLVETRADGTKVIDKDRRKSELDFIERGIVQELNEFRRTLAESSGQEREAMLRKLHERGQRLGQLAETFPNATSWLARAGLGSTERANLQATLAGAGKAELLSMAQQAQISGNRILAAAAVTANERLTRRDRPFVSIEYASRLVGDEHGQWLEAIAGARDKLNRVRDLDNLFTKGGESPTTKIERGLAKRKAA
ncbi:MAG: hypothetical protein WD795_05160 [Woeseia sp.]